MSQIFKKLYYALGGLGGALVVRNSTRDLNPKFSENVSASLVVDAELTEVFYTTESASETVSAAVTNLTVSLTSV